eukprot:TRINITY_DN5334_c0_g1_i1.p1 TRINITY_DN5334_c0_g1~~TRINITY_DN5334_c0_g1_i1.p1  ORF type:complete len:575 (+),score=103.01 TRINITY_DN5334_c0_g1_i1:40-1725(+)
MAGKEDLLGEGGINPRTLMAAFSDADQQGDGGLDMSEFRKFYGLVFPERPMTESLWKATSQMFQEIDADGSQEITFPEILNFLENTIADENARTRKPDSFAGYCWCLFGSGKTTWIKERSSTDFIILTTVHALEYVVTIMSIISLMITTLPEHQENTDGYLQGTEGTKVMELLTGSLFFLHFIGYTYSHPAFRKQQVEEPRPDAENTPEQEQEEVITPKAYLISPNTWINLLSWVPCFIAIDTAVESRYVLAVTTFRMFRLIRMLTITGSKVNVPKLGPALMKSIMSLWFLFLLIVISVSLSASFVFFLELEQSHFKYDEQKWYRDDSSIYLDAGSPLPFQSIPDAMWWALVTLTTVGYGDVSPNTIGGKIIATLTMLGGLVVVSYPITILTGTFHGIECEREIQEERQERARELYYGIKVWLDAKASDGGIELSGTAIPTKERAMPIITMAEKRKDVLAREILLCETHLMEQIRNLEKRVDRVVTAEKFAGQKQRQFQSPTSSPGTRPHAPRGELSSLSIPPVALKPLEGGSSQDVPSLPLSRESSGKVPALQLPTLSLN